MIAASSVSWYKTMTLAARMFRTTLTLSQDNRREDLVRTGMLRSSSPPTIPLVLRNSLSVCSVSFSCTSAARTTPTSLPSSFVTGSPR